MDLEWHEHTCFGQHEILHPADEWLRWDRIEVEYINRQKELRKTKDDDETKRSEIHLFQKILNNCRKEAK